MTFLQLRNLRDLDRLQPHDPSFLRLKAVIRVLRVCPNYGRNRRGRKAGGLVPNASDITFDNKDGRTVTVSVSHAISGTQNLCTHPQID